MHERDLITGQLKTSLLQAETLQLHEGSSELITETSKDCHSKRTQVSAAKCELLSPHCDHIDMQASPTSSPHGAKFQGQTDTTALGFLGWETTLETLSLLPHY